MILIDIMKFIIDHTSPSIYRKLQSHLMQIYLALLTKPKRILEIGIGEGFVSRNLKKYCEVITADIDKNLNPDLILDISNLNDFSKLKENSFDLIIMCEVLEHTPYNSIDSILQSLKKITKKYLLISVPNQGHFLNLILYKRGFDNIIFYPFNLILRLFLHAFNKLGEYICKIYYKIKKKKIKYKFNGEHYWELGIDFYSEESFRKKLKKHFIIEKEERLRENTYHHFFLLKKK